MKLGIVTATTSGARARAALESWAHRATPGGPLHALHVILNGGDTHAYLGTVPAFRDGVAGMLTHYPEVDVIACLHDDVEIQQDSWDALVARIFLRHPEVGLVGFGGATGLGADDLYQVPYDPMQLARRGYRSNTEDAEAHGMRSLVAEPVVCLDGFSQIGRRAFWEGQAGPLYPGAPASLGRVPPWQQLADLGMVHHFYDGALGCLARRLGWGVYYVPVRCVHRGGQTAVGDPGYQAWAAQQIEGGDRGFWETAHRIGYTEFRDVLPLRLVE